MSRKSVTLFEWSTFVAFGDTNFECWIFMQDMERKRNLFNL